MHPHEYVPFLCVACSWGVAFPNITVQCPGVVASDTSGVEHGADKAGAAPPSSRLLPFPLTSPPPLPPHPSPSSLVLLRSSTAKTPPLIGAGSIESVQCHYKCACRLPWPGGNWTSLCLGACKILVRSGLSPTSFNGSPTHQYTKTPVERAHVVTTLVSCVFVVCGSARHYCPPGE